MKKFMVLAALACSSAAFSATVTWSCSQTGAVQGLAGASGSNTGTVTCTNDTAALGGSGSLSFSNGLGHYSLDFTFNPAGPNPKQATFTVDGLGNLDLGATVVTQGSRPLFTSGLFGGSVAPLVADGGTVALLEAAARAGSNIVLPIGAITYLAGSTAVTAGTVDLAYTIDYADNSVPEPSTMVLLGSALVGIGMAARRRK